MDEWAAYIKRCEIEAGTEVGKNLSAEQGSHVKSTAPKKVAKAMAAVGEKPKKKSRKSIFGFRRASVSTTKEETAAEVSGTVIKQVSITTSRVPDVTNATDALHAPPLSSTLSNTHTPSLSLPGRSRW